MKKIKRIKRKTAEAAADLLLEDGGMAKLDQSRLKELMVEAARIECKERFPGTWTLWFVNHDSGCFSAGEAYKPLSETFKDIRGGK